MKFLILIIALSVSSWASASRCQAKLVSDEYPVEVVSIEYFMGQMYEYTILVPKEVYSVPMQKIYLLVNKDDGTVEDRMVVPVAYENDGANNIAKFAVNPKAEKYALQVWYGGNCGPRIMYEIK